MRAAGGTTKKTPWPRRQKSDRLTVWIARPKTTSSRLSPACITSSHRQVPAPSIHLRSTSIDTTAYQLASTHHVESLTAFLPLRVRNYFRRKWSLTVGCGSPSNWLFNVQIMCFGPFRSIRAVPSIRLPSPVTPTQRVDSQTLAETTLYRR